MARKADPKRRGGMIVYRTAQWHPELISHVFSVCTPFLPPSQTFHSTEDLVNGPLPQFGYQLHLAGPEVEAKVETRDQIKHFLQGVYGGKAAGGQTFFDPNKGFDLGILDTIGPSQLLDQQVRLDRRPPRLNIDLLIGD